MENINKNKDASNIILYTPYNRERPIIDRRMQEALTEDEFFAHCFVMFDADEKIGEIKKTDAKEFDTFDSKESGHIVKTRIINDLEDLKSNEAIFFEWLKERGNSIFCVKGNAGVGKTSYLHYLKYIYERDFIWEIIDIQSSNEMVNILNGSVCIEIPNYKNLINKVISVFISHISDYIFGTVNGIIIDNNNVLDSFDAFVLGCNKEIEESSFHHEMILDLFYFTNDNYSDKDVMAYAKKLKIKFENVLNSKASQSRLINDFWRILEFVLIVRFGKGKFVICFDNFERFIGSEEIWNVQLYNFIENIRSLIDSRSHARKDFNENFKFIMFMRNTTSRMANPSIHSISMLHELEFDISEMFPIEDIIDKKIRWCSERGISVPNKEFIEMILGYGSFDGTGLRSMQYRLSKLFNYNKRSVLKFMTRILRDSSEPALEEFVSFANNKHKIIRPLNRAAGRSIIYRLFLDELIKDSFFNHLLVTDIGTKQKRLGISRKMLTVLSNFKQMDRNNKYMPFEDFITEYIGKRDGVDRLFGVSGEQERKQLIEVLFYMNYYNKNKEDWTHFVDIQYNSTDIDSYLISDHTDLDRLMINYKEKVKIKIMPAGEAYLEFIVPSFEYFACRAGRGEKAEICEPLFALIPTHEDMEREDLMAKNLACIQVISRVYNDARDCIERLNNDPDTKRLVYKSTKESNTGFTQIERIINYHTGYISNFEDCIQRIYSDDKNDQVTFNLKKICDELHNYTYHYKELKNKGGTA